jgi:hypothetical protein
MASCVLNRNSEPFVSPAFVICQFLLIFPGGWSVLWGGYVNIISESTKSDKWYLSDKIMSLYSVCFKRPAYPHGKACHPRVNIEVNPQMQHAIAAKKLNRHLGRAGKTRSSDLMVGQGLNGRSSQDTRVRPTVTAELGFGLTLLVNTVRNHHEFKWLTVVCPHVSYWNTSWSGCLLWRTECNSDVSAGLKPS